MAVNVLHNSLKVLQDSHIAWGMQNKKCRFPSGRGILQVLLLMAFLVRSYVTLTKDTCHQYC